MTFLHQILALEKDKKARSYREVTDAHHQLNPTNVKLSGITRTYQPKNEDGDKLPSESTLLQLQASTVLAQIKASLIDLFNITLTKDEANQKAKADLYVDEQLIARDVPVTYLLFMEKQLTDVITIVSKLPVLDPAEHWEWSPAADAYAASSQTARTKKVPRNHVRAEATDKHPAQVEMYFEDEMVGTWTTTKYSGALSQVRVTKMQRRAVKLLQAVKTAREQANSLVVGDQPEIGEAVFGYLFEN